MKIRTLLALAILFSCGCEKTPAPTAPNAVMPAPRSEGYDIYGNIDPSQVVFRDDVESQGKPEVPLVEMELATPEGIPQSLRSLLKDGNLVVVVTRGFTTPICPFCSTQTSRLIANYSEIKKRGADVVVIHPLQKSDDRPRVSEFLARVNELSRRDAKSFPPFPFLIDDGLKLVDALGIRKDLSKPATYILDPTGAIRFAYVGESLADRPSIKAVLQQLDSLRGDAADQTSATSGTKDDANPR